MATNSDSNKAGALTSGATPRASTGPATTSIVNEQGNVPASDRLSETWKRATARAAQPSALQKVLPPPTPSPGPGTDASPVHQGNPGPGSSSPGAPTNIREDGNGESKAPEGQNSTARFRQLARIDRQNRERAKALKAQQAALAEQERELAELREAKRLAAENPLEAAKRLGISTDAYVQYLVQNPPPPPPDPVAADLGEVKAKIAAYEEQAAQVAAAQKDAADEARLQAWAAENGKRVSEHADSFPHLLKLEDWQEEVLNLVVQHFSEQEGDQREVLDFVEAARLVEEHYEEQAVLEQFRAEKKAKLAAAAAAAEQGDQTGTPDLDEQGDGHQAEGDPEAGAEGNGLHSAASLRSGTRLEAAGQWTPSRPTERYVGDAPSLSNRVTSAPAAGTSPSSELLPVEESIRRAARHLRFR